MLTRVLIIILGGRGYHEEVWPTKTDISSLMNTYTSTSPVESIPSIKYGTQSIFSSIKYETRKYEKIGATFKGFLKPPYSGWFNLMVKADDQSNFYLHTGENNVTVHNLVSAYWEFKAAEAL